MGPNASDEARSWYGRQTDAPRVNCAETGWFGRIRAAELFVYTFDAASFSLHDGAAGHWVATAEITPLRVDPVGDLVEKHVACGDELRFVPSLWPLREYLPGSGLGFSMTRLRNASLPRG